LISQETQYNFYGTDRKPHLKFWLWSKLVDNIFFPPPTAGGIEGVSIILRHDQNSIPKEIFHHNYTKVLSPSVAWGFQCQQSLPRQLGGAIGLCTAFSKEIAIYSAIKDR
jgi:hypothetical protein